MPYKIIIREEAHVDTQEAFGYYEKIRVGMREEFLIELIKGYDMLAIQPGNYSFINEQKDKILRDVVVNRFPYVILLKL